jgi:hypothetical protein
MQRIEGALAAFRNDSAFSGFGSTDLDGVQVRTVPGWLQSLWPDGTNALTLRRTILFHPDVETEWTDKNLTRLIAHELVHIRQFRQLGFGSFVIRYTFDYLSGRIQGLGHNAAYAAIELEVEARDAGERADPES